MDNLEEQVELIKAKLNLSKRIDRRLKVFGSSSHKYEVGNVVSEKNVIDFEEKYKIKLPKSYKIFLTQIGNGGNSFLNSAAGPFYGIYPLGENVDELIDHPEIYLSKEVKIYPNMTNEFWEKLTSKIDSDEDMTDNEFETEMGNLYAGLLPIGSQGCTYLHALILNGKNRGRVVNLDISRQKPIFTHEENFLDWYERWLDEVISGELLKLGPKWFGYSIRKSSKIGLKELERYPKKWYEIWK